jgi:hypothetical protein
MSEEKIVALNTAEPGDAGAAVGLAIAAEKFRKAFAERSFSQRHEDLGKMINCRLCGRRHREDDPLAKLSRAHGDQTKNEMPPSRAALTKKQRIHPHHNPKVHFFAQLAEKIFTEDIKPYFQPDPEHPDNLIRRAQRRAALILRKQWVAARVLRKRMQAVSRRINFGLLPGGSR